MMSLQCHAYRLLVSHVEDYYKATPAPLAIVDQDASDHGGDASAIVDLLGEKTVAEVNKSDWPRIASRIGWLLPTALNYYLPGIYAASINLENNQDTWHPNIDFDILDSLIFYFTPGDLFRVDSYKKSGTEINANLSSKTIRLSIMYFILAASIVEQADFDKVIIDRCLSAALVLSCCNQD
ncbi:MAG: hypothetical protein K8U03_08745 [Planctomycetia bacterium]|nr:hypothetical protein [Planctomycetia bacterium]